jgi:hypothetical protein
MRFIYTNYKNISQLSCQDERRLTALLPGRIYLSKKFIMYMRWCCFITLKSVYVNLIDVACSFVEVIFVKWYLERDRERDFWNVQSKVFAVVFAVLAAGAVVLTLNVLLLVSFFFSVRIETKAEKLGKSQSHSIKRKETFADCTWL